MSQNCLQRLGEEKEYSMNNKIGRMFCKYVKYGGILLGVLICIPLFRDKTNMCRPNFHLFPLAKRKILIQALYKNHTLYTWIVKKEFAPATLQH